MNAARQAAYESIFEDLSVDGAVLSSDAAVQHASGVHIYTQQLIPERPVVAVVGGGRVVLVCWEWELAQIQREQPGLETVGFAEFGADPWAAIAEVARDVVGSSGRVVLEGTCPGPAAAALTGRVGGVTWDAGSERLMSARTVKDEAEISMFRTLSRRADEAIADVAATCTPADTELALSRLIFERFRDSTSGLVEGAGICSGPAHNMSNHHLAEDTPIGVGPVRFGIKAQIDGYWLVLTRMGDAGGASANAAFADDYARYLDAYRAGIELLRPGTPAGQVYEGVRSRLERSGLRLRSAKVGHGTGLSFREMPILRANDETELRAGTVLAYDFAVHPESTRAGMFVHVEDRVLVTEEGAVRLSDATDIGKPYLIAEATGALR